MPLSPPKGASKATVLSFPKKNRFCWKKVCCKGCLCENCQRQNCKAFTGLSICAEMVGGGRPLLPEIFGRRGPPSFKNGDFHSIFARSGSTVGASEKSSITRKRAIAKALHIEGHSDFAPVDLAYYQHFLCFLFKNIAFWEVPPPNHKYRIAYLNVDKGCG